MPYIDEGRASPVVGHDDLRSGKHEKVVIHVTGDAHTLIDVQGL